MRLKSVLNILREIKYLKSVIKTYRHMLTPGKYCLLDGFRSLALNDQSTLNSAHRYFDKPNVNHKMASVARILNRLGYFYIKSKKSSAEYQALYTANNYDAVREIKLFSFEKNRILTICTSTTEAANQIAQYELLKSSYSLPVLKKCEHYQNAYEISMVKLKPMPGEFYAVKSIADSTISFNPSPASLRAASLNDLVSFSFENEEENELLHSIAESIDPELLPNAIPICLQHGDLSKDNLLYGESDGNNGFWWIDWEHLSDRVFFYDFFFYILNSALYYNKDAFNNYLSGALDEILIPFFSHFGLSFTPKNRVDWLLAFAVIFLKERVCGLGRTEALKLYCRFLKENLE